MLNKQFEDVLRFTQRFVDSTNFFFITKLFRRFAIII